MTARRLWLAAALLAAMNASALAQTGTDDLDQEPASDWGEAKARSEAEKAAYDAAKAAADARKAATDAQTAATRAKVGSVQGQTAIAGTSNDKTDTGKAEALLLVTRAVGLAATDIASALLPTLAKQPAGEVLVLTDINQLAVPDAVQFDVQVAAIAKLLDTASVHYDAACRNEPTLPGSEGGSEDRTALTSVGALVDAASKLGSYFLTDYAFGAANPTTPADLVAVATVAAIKGKRPAQRLVIPADALASDASGIIATLAPLQEKYVEVAGKGETAKIRATELRRADATDAAAGYDVAQAAATKAVAAYESFVNALVSATAGQEVAAARIVRQKKLQRMLAPEAKPLILLLQSEEAGAYYTKKNLWTFLGGPPLHTMGGLSVVYTLYDPTSGGIHDAGAVAKHGGYRSVRAVEAMFKGPSGE